MSLLCVWNYGQIGLTIVAFLFNWNHKLVTALIVFETPLSCMLCSIRNCEMAVITNNFLLNTVCTISLMAFDRFLFTYRPLKYQQYITPIRVALVLVVTWVLTTLVGFIPVFGYGDIIFNQLLLSCFVIMSLDNGYYSLILLVVTGFLLLPFVIFNVWVCCIAQRNIWLVYSVKTGNSAISTNQPKNKLHASRGHVKRRN